MQVYLSVISTSLPPLPGSRVVGVAEDDDGQRRSKFGRSTGRSGIGLSGGTPLERKVSNGSTNKD